MHEAVNNKTLQMSAIETKWLDRIERTVSSIPDDSDQLLTKITQSWPGVFIPTEYGLKT